MRGILVALPLVSLPLSLSGISKLSQKQIELLKKVFVYSCFIISIIYFFQTAIRIGLMDGSFRSQTGPVGYKSPYLVYNLTYHQLTPSIHAVFFSLYLSFAVIILMFGFKKKTIQSKILQAIVIVYFLLYLIMLTSAMINFALYSFITICIFLRSSFKKVSHYFKFIGIMIIGTAITDYLLIVKYIGPDIGNIIYRFDSVLINQNIIISFIITISTCVFAILIKLTNKRIHKAILKISFFIITLAGFFYLKNSINNSSTADWQLNNISVRASYNSEAIRIIKKHPFFGVGIGDKKYKLIDRNLEPGDNRYIEFGTNIKPDQVFNPHNQFFDFWIAAGIVPVICFLFFFINQFSKAIRFHHTVYVGLLYCFCLFCFTDMAMMIQRGQIFFLFFICLFDNELERIHKPENFLS